MRNKMMGILVVSAMVLSGCSSMTHTKSEVKSEVAMNDSSHDVPDSARQVAPAADTGTILRSLCAQIVEEVDDAIGKQVTACIPAASVQNGQPDLLMIISKAHFAEEKLRTIWIGLSIGKAVQAIEKLPQGNTPHVKALMVDLADQERKSMEELKLCTVSMTEAEMLSKRHQDGDIKGWSEVYRSSHCNKQAPARSQ